jgi:phage terminase large subunit-like protein
MLRLLARTDLYFLIRYLLQRKDLENEWLFARCREVQENPDGYLDLWPRGHYKSTIITFAKTIQDILASHGDDPLPEWDGMTPTFAIFSHTRPIAKSFLRQIKVEFEQNVMLRELFPDVLYDSPESQAPRWSEDAGIVVKRQVNPKEATVEAWGLVDGQPVGKHFNVLIYDDVVTMAGVSNPDMIRKTTEAWELSLNLGDRAPRKRYIGTRYHFADSYRAMMEREAVIPRLHAGTDDATLAGVPVFLTQEQWDQKVKEMGPYAASSQLLLNPVADSKHTFRREWLRFFEEASGWRGMNRVLICDPADSKDKHADYTAMGVIAKGPDRNLYVLDFFRDRIGIKERATEYLAMHRRWKPQFSGYEKYGKDVDISYILEMQNRENYRFDIEELKGPLSKVDRINRLLPIAAEHRLYLPAALLRTSSEGKLVDLHRILVEEEMLAWPVPAHDDLLDMISRVFDFEDLTWPQGADVEEGPRKDRYNRPARGNTWMSG